MNSKLVDVTGYSPNHSGPRAHTIDRITPHCFVGQVSAERIISSFKDKKKQASCNYGIGEDGRVCLVVDESNRSWCSSSAENDNRAVTIECASNRHAPYAFHDAVYSKLVELCHDICVRNGKDKLIWIDSREKALAYEPKADEMLLTVHRWFSNKECPGQWMFDRMGALAEKVTKLLGTGFPAYRVQIGSFKNQGNAVKCAKQAKEKGFQDAFVRSAVVNGEMFYRVQIGYFKVRSNAELTALRAEGFGFQDAFVQVVSE